MHTFPDIYRKQDYPKDVLIAIQNSGQMGIDVTNRWMLGWPKKVKALLEAGEYLPAFQYQVEAEKIALARATDMSHLVPREIAELYGLSMEPASLNS